MGIIVIVAFGLSLDALSAPSNRLDQWIARVWPEVQKSDPILGIQKLLESARAGMKAYEHSAPWSVEASIQRSDRQTSNPADNAPFQIDYGLTAALTYQSQVGPTCKISTDLKRSRIDNYAFIAGTTINDPTSSTALEMSLDVLRLGESHPLWIKNRIESLSRLQSQYNYYQQLVEAEEAAYAALVEFYKGVCKINELKTTEEIVAKILKTARLKLDSKLIATKDYLNFANLAGNLKVRIATQRAATVSTAENLRTYGESVFSASHLDPETMPPCDRNDLVRERFSWPSENEWIVGSPSTLASRTGVRLAAAKLESVLVTLRPALSPFASASYWEATSRAERSAISGTVGVKFAWALPGDRTSLLETEARSALFAAESAERSSISGSRTRYFVLKERVRAQTAILNALRENLSQLEKLQMTLEIGLTTGGEESLNFFQAVANRIDATQAVFDAWAILEQTAFQIRSEADLIERLSKNEKL